MGGQSVEQATQTLELALREHVSRPVVVRTGGRKFTLTAKDARLKFDPLRTAKRAYYEGRDKGPGVEVDLALKHSSKRVRAFAERVDEEVRVKPKDASVRITLTQIFLRKGKIGRTINEHELARVIDKLLADPALKREIRTKLNPDRPEVRTSEMRARYRTVVTVDRDHLVLRLFKACVTRGRTTSRSARPASTRRPGSSTSRASRSTRRGTCPTDLGPGRSRGRRSRAAPPTTRSRRAGSA